MELSEAQDHSGSVIESKDHLVIACCVSVRVRWQRMRLTRHFLTDEDFLVHLLDREDERNIGDSVETEVEIQSVNAFNESSINTDDSSGGGYDLNLPDNHRSGKVTRKLGKKKNCLRLGLEIAKKRKRQAVRFQNDKNRKKRQSSSLRTGKIDLRDCFYCPLCSIAHYNIGNHVKLHYKKTSYSGVSCVICKNSLDGASAMEVIEHALQSHDIRLYVCEICKKAFREKENAAKHLKKHSKVYDKSDNAEDVFMCFICVKSYSKKYAFLEHMRKHSGKDMRGCPVCNKQFSRMTYLRKHMKLHKESRKFQCDRCEVHFDEEKDLQMHVEIHGTIKNRPKLVCNVCEKIFQIPANYEKHKKIHEGGSDAKCGEKKSRTSPKKCHQCELCGKSYTTATSLKYHARSHTGELPYECRLCDRKFRTVGILKQHSKIHSESKPYVCSACGKGFRRKSLLDQHSRSHSENRPLECKDCGKNYKYYADLAKHRKSCHDEIGVKSAVKSSGESGKSILKIPAVPQVYQPAPVYPQLFPPSEMPGIPYLSRNHPMYPVSHLPGSLGLPCLLTAEVMNEDDVGMIPWSGMGMNG